MGKATSWCKEDWWAWVNPPWFLADCWMGAVLGLLNATFRFLWCGPLHNTAVCFFKASRRISHALNLSFQKEQDYFSICLLASVPTTTCLHIYTSLESKLCNKGSEWSSDLSVARWGKTFPLGQYYSAWAEALLGISDTASPPDYLLGRRQASFWIGDLGSDVHLEPNFSCSGGRVMEINVKETTLEMECGRLGLMGTLLQPKCNSTHGI